MRRVVVTGLGTINPLGNNVENSWNSLINSKSGISKITKFDVENYPCKIAGSIDDSKINKIVRLLEQKSDEKYLKGDFKGAIRALRRSEKYLAN